MSNFSTAVEATDVALNSAGSAANENAAYMEGLEAKTNLVASSFQELSNNAIESEVVKIVLDGINAALEALNTPLGLIVTRFVLLTGVLTGAFGIFGPIIAKITGMISAVSKAGGIISALGNVFSTAAAGATALGTGMTAAGAGAGAAATGFTAFSAAALPIAGIIAGIVVAIGAVVSIVDHFTVSLEEQQEKVSSLSNEVSNLRSEYEQLKSSDNLTEADERRLKILEAQIKANETLLQQEAKKQYSMQFGEESRDLGAAGITGLDHLRINIKQLKDYKAEIQSIEDEILNLDKNSEDYSEQVLKLSQRHEDLTERMNGLNEKVATQVKEISDLGEQMGRIPLDAEDIINAYLEWAEVTSEVSQEAQTLTDKIKAIADVEILPKDAESMEDWLKSLSETEFSNLEEMLHGLGSEADDLSNILSHMEGEDAIRLITQAYKEYYGIIDDATAATNRFQEALETNYTESIENMIQAVDYVSKSQQNGITNAQAYQAALEMVYGTADEALIQVADRQAQVNDQYNQGGSVMQNYMGYFENGAFNAEKLYNQILEVSQAEEGLVEVSGSLEDHDLSVQISDFGELAEVLGLSDTTLQSLIEAMAIYGNIDIGASVDAGTAALQSLNEAGEDWLSTYRSIFSPEESGITGIGLTPTIDTTNIDETKSKLEDLQQEINKTSDLTGVELSFDFDDMSVEEVEEAANQIYEYITKINEYVSDSGNWDFSSLGDLDNVEISGDSIVFKTDGAAENFKTALLGSLEGTDMGDAISANLLQNFTLDTSALSGKGEEIINTIVESANSTASTTQIAWSGIFGDLAGQLTIATEDVGGFQTGTQDAITAVQELNGQSLSSLSSQFGNAKSSAGGLKTTLDSINNTLRNLTNSKWTINIAYNTTGSIPSAPKGGVQSRLGHKGYAMGKAPDGAEFLRTDVNTKDLVGEEGPELKISSTGSQELVGINGPELIDLNKGDTILPANITNMLATGQIRGFAGGYTSVNGTFLTKPGQIQIGDVTSAYDGSTIAIGNNTVATNQNAAAQNNAANATNNLTSAVESQQEAFDEQNAIMEHQIFLREKQGASYEELIQLNRDYQKQLEDQANWYRQHGYSDDSEEIRQLQKDWWSVEDDITQLQRDAFDERLKDSEDYIEERNRLNDWGADNEIDAWNRVVEWMDEWYAQGLIDYEYYLEKRQEALENAQDAERAALEEQANVYETLFSVVARKAQEEIDALEEQRSQVEDYWNSQIDALQEVNDELDDQIEKEKALDAVAKARQTKVMVYKDGRFQYVNDIDEVSEAQANLEELERQQALEAEIKRLEELRDKELASIDDQIAGWQEYKDEWASVVEDYQQKQDELLLEQELGIKLEGENWTERLDDLQFYIDEYNRIMDQLNGSYVSDEGLTAPEFIGGRPMTPGDNAENTTDWSQVWWDAENNPNLSQEEKEAIQDWAHSQKEQEMSGSGATYDPVSGTWHYASGTLSAKGGLSLVGENGPELRVVKPTDGIIPADITKNLWSWGMLTPSSMMQTLSGIGKTMMVNIQNLNLPEVKNGQDFVNYMKNNFWRRTVQFETSI